MKKSTMLFTVLVAIAAFSGSLQAGVFVYEPFDYEVGTKLETQSGGYGMTGNWLDIGGGYNGFAYIYDETPGTTQVGNDGGPLKWDGVVNNLPTSPVVGSRYISNGTGDGDKCASYRYLAESAGQMAGDDGILWASVVWHAPGTGYGEHAGLALGTDAFSNRSVNFDASGSYGAGLGNGIGVGGAFNSRAITPVIYDGGAIAVRTTAGATNYVTSLDNIIVLKFEFGATDTVTAYTFTEDAELSEATFNANAVSATSTIDESTLNILTFSQVRGGNALDEIRIGDTFLDVIGQGVLTYAEVDAGSDWVTWSGMPVQLDDVTVVNNDTDAGPLTLSWRADAPAGVTAEFSDSSIEEPLVTITKSSLDGKAANVKLILNVSQSGKLDVESYMTVNVYDDACKAAVGVGQHVISPADFDTDCATDFDDLILMAASWLYDFSLTEAVDK